MRPENMENVHGLGSWNPEFESWARFPESLDQIGLQRRHDFVEALFRMDVQVNRLGQIQTEDSHDGLGIDDISAGYQVKVIIKLGNVIDEGLHLVNGV